jgi:uncharacterized protein YijF (DUF1287 family)
MKIIFLIIPLFAGTLFLCNNTTINNKPSEKKTDTLKRPGSNDPISLTQKQKKILEGARKCLGEKFRYDMDMAYLSLNYKNGVNTNKQVYPMGDIQPDLGVCVEVTIRALRYAGIVDLQQAIHEDLKTHWQDYPMSRWGAKQPDVNIDHRRVPNQRIWFKKNWNEIGESGNYRAGDVVVWDMNEDSWGDHIGILSDIYGLDENLKVIHNFPSPGYVAEEDVLNRGKIIGHFRVKE